MFTENSMILTCSLPVPESNFFSFHIHFLCSAEWLLVWHINPWKYGKNVPKRNCVTNELLKTDNIAAVVIGAPVSRVIVCWWFSKGIYDQQLTNKTKFNIRALFSVLTGFLKLHSSWTIWFWIFRSDFTRFTFSSLLVESLA